MRIVLFSSLERNYNFMSNHYALIKYNRLAWVLRAIKFSCVRLGL